MAEIICIQCGAPFEAERRNATLCSEECRRARKLWHTRQWNRAKQGLPPEAPHPGAPETGPFWLSRPKLFDPEVCAVVERALRDVKVARAGRFAVQRVRLSRGNDFALVARVLVTDGEPVVPHELEEIVATGMLRAGKWHIRPVRPVITAPRQEARAA